MSIQSTDKTYVANTYARFPVSIVSGKGSEVFDETVFEDTVDVMTAFMAELHKGFGFVTEMLNVGGGYGVRYLDTDKHIDAIKGAKPTQITELVKRMVKERKISDASCHKDLWQLLHDAGLYPPTNRNWNTQISG